MILGNLRPGRAAAAGREFRVSIRTIQKIIKTFKASVVAVDVEPLNSVKNKRFGQIHNRSKFTPLIKTAMFEITQQHIKDGVLCSDRKMQESLKLKGMSFALKTVQSY